MPILELLDDCHHLTDKYEIEKDMLLKQIKKYGEEKGFKLKQSKMGIVFLLHIS